MPDESCPIQKQRLRVILAGVVMLAVLLACVGLLPFARSVSASARRSGASPASRDAAQAHTPISIDYPEDGSIFPPGITPPTFIWRDASTASKWWRIRISFGDKSPAIEAVSHGDRMQIGPIDPECVGPTNKPPSLNPQQAASWTWIPDAATWSAIQQHSVAEPATIAITGYSADKSRTSESRSTFTTSRDPVGAPIFYRDVPLMPSAGADGTVSPLAADAVRLIHWRLRDIRKPESHIVIKSVPTCMNCHSFSMDGKTMGIDVDGPANDKGMYALAPISKHISIENKEVVHWNSDGEVGTTRVGFMSQVSPDGQYVVSTFAGPSLDVPRTYYITNFTDYRFLQVFYPTKGILEWYSRETGTRHPLPGADDPHYVQTDGVWSPDGKWIVFARAVARNPRERGQPAATQANDPNETQIKYELYRVPFNAGRGGTPERIVGASENGMSNNFPKVSPDGRWIVFVQCKNGQLMRPDSQLYIVPFGGGTARRLRANTSLMNSWHSFSPNGRWLVFSSKARSPYTQMYLTHIDANGNDSPAILIDNSTASNRAVNLPEFVNIPGDGIEDIQVPAIDGYRLMDQALALEREEKYAEALEVWKKAVALEPDDARVQSDIAANLFLSGNIDEALEHIRESVRLNPGIAQSHYYLGAFLLKQGHPDQAVPELETALKIYSRYPSGEATLAAAYSDMGKDSEALIHLRKAIDHDPTQVVTLVDAARILSSSSDPTLRNGAEAVGFAKQANDLTKGSDPDVLDTLAAAYAEAGEYDQALDAANRALNLAAANGDSAKASAIRYRIGLYTDGKPYRQ
jgi:tetratricopeptide (TPR) repeat protein